MELLDTTVISIASGTQMRAAIDVDTVNDYATKLDELPPITVFYDGSRYYCADGFHRLDAHRASGRTTIACDVKSGTLRDAILYAAGANATHGKRRTNADKRRAIETLLRDEEWRAKSNRWIADVVKVGDQLVAVVRDELYPQKHSRDHANDITSTPRVVQKQDGRTYTVPQRPAKPTPQPQAMPRPPVVVTEQPVAAPRVQQKPKADNGLRQIADRLRQIEAELSDKVDDLASGAIDGDEDKIATVAASLELALMHLRQAAYLAE